MSMPDGMWTLSGRPVTFVALAGNAKRRVVFGVEVEDENGNLLKLSPNKEGVIVGLLCGDKSVNVNSVEWTE